MAASHDGGRWHAIAYQHAFVPEADSDRDVDLAIAWGRGPLSKKADYQWAVHPVSLGRRSPADELAVFSGTSGVAHPVLGADSNEQEGALERVIASQIHLVISQSIKNETSSSFLVEGPLLRKLLGRLAYRYYDPNVLCVLAIDSDERRLRAACPKSASWEPRAISAGQASLYGPNPALSFDAPVRRYEIVFEDRRRLFVEVPCCALGSANMHQFHCDFLPKRLSEIAESVLLEDKSQPPLPPILLHARQAAQQHHATYISINEKTNWFYNNIRQFRSPGKFGAAAEFVNEAVAVLKEAGLNAAASSTFNRLEAFPLMRAIAARDPDHFLAMIGSLQKTIGSGN